MELDWDAANLGHISRHGISPEEREQAYLNGPFEIEQQVRKGENRHLCLGETSGGRLLTFVITEPLAGRRGASGAEALLHASGNTVNRVLPGSGEGRFAS